MRDFWDAQSKWSQATFGTDAERGPLGALKHLRKEIEEVKANPGDIEERADLVFLALDASRRAGYSYDAIELCDLEPQEVAEITIDDLVSMVDRLIDMLGKSALIPMRDYCAVVAAVFCLAMRAGFDLDELQGACWNKLSKNKKRTWVKTGTDEPTEHNRD
jgi:hypothetical protein